MDIEDEVYVIIDIEYIYIEDKACIRSDIENIKITLEDFLFRRQTKSKRY
jgi:hypothetical protein